jgi:hypothetical protein
MKGLSKRIDRILRRSHVFISEASFRLVVEYSKDLLDELNIDSESYKEELESINSLWKKYLESGNQEHFNNWRKLLEKSSVGGVPRISVQK